MTFWHTGSRSPGWWIAALLGSVTLVTYLAGLVQHGTLEAKPAYLAGTMTVGMLVGLWAWGWRPTARIGLLMFLWPALWLASDLPVAFPDSSIASTIGLALLVMGPIVLAQMALSYPTGRLIPGRLAWIYIFVLGYAAQVIQNVVNMLFWNLSGCEPCPPPHAPTVVYVGAPPFSLETWNKGWAVFVMAILPIGLYVLYRAYAVASIAGRRSLGPVLLTATLITCASWVYLYGIVTDRLSWLSPISWVLTSGALAVALTSLIGLAMTHRTRGSIGTLVVELEQAGPGAVRPALTAALGDPTLEVALWLPERDGWADEEGREVSLPDGPDRAVTYVGEKLAAIVHDPVLLDQPALLEAAGSAARLALENERLQAALRSQLAELRESRARIVRAGDEERRRLERDLHDGAQQRLLGIGMALQLLRSRVGGEPEAEALLAETEVEVQGALRELRELARGIHPAVLTDQGLDAAVRTLAERAPLAVEIETTSDRLPAHVETAAYFVVAEALANVAKYAHATRAWVTIEHRDGQAVIEVGDDGVGGARANGTGSGLRGLSDRVGALDGHMTIDSSPGGGTRIVAVIPCAS